MLFTFTKNYCSSKSTTQVLFGKAVRLFFCDVYVFGKAPILFFSWRKKINLLTVKVILTQYTKQSEVELKD